MPGLKFSEGCVISSRNPKDGGKHFHAWIVEGMFAMKISLPSDAAISTVDRNYEAARNKFCPKCIMRPMQDFLTKLFSRNKSHESLYLCAVDRYVETRIKLTEEDFLLLCITLVTLQ